MNPSINFDVLGKQQKFQESQMSGPRNRGKMASEGLNCGSRPAASALKPLCRRAPKPLHLPRAHLLFIVLRHFDIHLRYTDFKIQHRFIISQCDSSSAINIL